MATRKTTTAPEPANLADLAAPANPAHAPAPAVRVTAPAPDTYAAGQRNGVEPTDYPAGWFSVRQLDELRAAGCTVEQI